MALDPESREQLLAEVARLRSILAHITDEGAAVALVRAITAIEAALTAAEHSPNTQDVTAAQSQRRGRAIAAAMLDETDAKRVSLVGRWGSLRKAAKALQISPASLVAYLNGTTATPRRVAARALKEAGIALDSWKSVVD